MLEPSGYGWRGTPSLLQTLDAWLGMLSGQSARANPGWGFMHPDCG